MVDGHPLMVGGHPSGIILPAAQVAEQARPVLATLFGPAAPASPAPAAADSEATAGRALGRRFADAVVGVELVASINLTASGRALLPARSVSRRTAPSSRPDGRLHLVTSLIEIEPRRTAEARRPGIFLQGGRARGCKLARPPTTM